jgi:hypothetical protein
MAETPDPNASPMHHEIEPRFAALYVWVAGLLGFAAITVGIVLGLLLAND